MKKYINQLLRIPRTFQVGIYGVTTVGLTLYIIEYVSFFFKATDPALKGASWCSSQIFFIAISVFFWVGIAQILFRFNRLASFAGSIPTHLTALGILGTFFGIFIGLYKFDAKDLHTSVPLLLDGMKLAFSTSIGGLTASTLLKITHTISISIFQMEDPFREKEEDPYLKFFTITLSDKLDAIIDNIDSLRDEKVKKDIENIASDVFNIKNKLTSMNIDVNRLSDDIDRMSKSRDLSAKDIISMSPANFEILKKLVKKRIKVDEIFRFLRGESATPQDK